MSGPASELARRLARNAEAVCRHYLSNGHRSGAYWLVGDVDNQKGRSLFVRLSGADSGKGAAGRWMDAATGEHGDLLDLIAASRRLGSMHEVLEEARAFLALPRPIARRREPAPSGSPEAARRLFAMARPLRGTLAETYMESRGLTNLQGCRSLRFHGSCYYRSDSDDPRDRARTAWPALIAAVTDGEGEITGVQRTWLDPSGAGKANVSTPRRALGQLHGHAVRFGEAGTVMAAGEGIETVLSLRRILPTLPMAAALSASHLAALILPPGLQRLYIARDKDDAGRAAAATLAARATDAGVETLLLDPALADFNDDLRALGAAALAASLRVQLAPDDRVLLVP